MPKLLVVDDEADLVNMLTFRLEKDGFEVLSCGDGQTAVEMAEQERPDLVILDIMLPLVDGIEALRQIRSTRTTMKIPVIMLTARTDNMPYEESRELWVSDYIMKPFDPEKLMSKVRKALKLPTV